MFHCRRWDLLAKKITVSSGNKKLKYYAVAKGSQVGIFSSWDSCKGFVIGVKGSKYESFTKKSDAERFVKKWARSVGSGQSYSAGAAPSSDVPTSSLSTSKSNSESGQNSGAKTAHHPVTLSGRGWSGIPSAGAREKKKLVPPALPKKSSRDEYCFPMLATSLITPSSPVLEQKLKQKRGKKKDCKSGFENELSSSAAAGTTDPLAPYLKVYTDGSYLPATNETGIGLFFGLDAPRDLNRSEWFADLGAELRSNNRAELFAVIRAMQEVPTPYRKLLVVTDSLYVVRLAESLDNNTGCHKSEVNGGKSTVEERGTTAGHSSKLSTKSKKKVLVLGGRKELPVKNRDLWEKYVQQRHRWGGEVKFQWVKGHQRKGAAYGNEMADYLAGKASTGAGSQSRTGGGCTAGGGDVVL